MSTQEEESKIHARLEAEIEEDVQALHRQVSSIIELMDHLVAVETRQRQRIKSLMLKMGYLWTRSMKVVGAAHNEAERALLVPTSAHSLKRTDVALLPAETPSTSNSQCQILTSKAQETTNNGVSGSRSTFLMPPVIRPSENPLFARPAGQITKIHPLSVMTEKENSDSDTEDSLSYSASCEWTNSISPSSSRQTKSLPVFPLDLKTTDTGKLATSELWAAVKGKKVAGSCAEFNQPPPAPPLPKAIEMVPFEKENVKEKKPEENPGDDKGLKTVGGNAAKVSEVKTTKQAKGDGKVKVTVQRDVQELVKEAPKVKLPSSNGDKSLKPEPAPVPKPSAERSQPEVTSKSQVPAIVAVLQPSRSAEPPATAVPSKATANQQQKFPAANQPSPRSEEQEQLAREVLMRDLNNLECLYRLNHGYSLQPLGTGEQRIYRGVQMTGPPSKREYHEFTMVAYPWPVTVKLSSVNQRSQYRINRRRCGLLGLLKALLFG